MLSISHYDACLHSIASLVNGKESRGDTFPPYRDWTWINIWDYIKVSAE